MYAQTLTYLFLSNVLPCLYFGWIYISKNKNQCKIRNFYEFRILFFYRPPKPKILWILSKLCYLNALLSAGNSLLSGCLESQAMTYYSKSSLRGAYWITVLRDKSPTDLFPEDIKPINLSQCFLDTVAPVPHTSMNLFTGFCLLGSPVCSIISTHPFSDPSPSALPQLFSKLLS